MTVDPINKNLSWQTQAAQWIFNHPTTVKVGQAAALVFSLASLALLPLALPVLGLGATIGLGIAGMIAIAVFSLASIGLQLVAPPHHDMKNHVYKPAACAGGKLFYEGDIPILSLEAEDPLKAGYAHGYLCGAAIERVAGRFDWVLHSLAGEPRAASLPKTIAAMKKVIPAEYLLEMEGLVNGYNQWAKEHFWKFPKKLTLEDLLLSHLMPDSIYFCPARFEGRKEKPIKQLAFACSALIDRGEQGEIQFARNMDWPSLGLIGTYSLVINRRYKNGKHNTVEVGVPGFIGTLTGMNRHGLSLAMNVSFQGFSVDEARMPSAFYNRQCLEKCRCVEEVNQFVKQVSPLGPYHLTVADSSSAESIHFYQGLKERHAIRNMGTAPLVTLNEPFSAYRPDLMNQEELRNVHLNAFFQKKRPLEEALSLPEVNNGFTTHKVLMEPQTNTFKVAFDNAFAGNTPLHNLSTDTLLELSASPKK